MLTGGTGFLGGHVVGALLAEGHEPHLLVRDPDKLKRLCDLHALGPGTVLFTVGDITDERSVLRALEGCDACVHTAAVTSYDPADTPTIEGTNAAGARLVLDAAVSAGCNPVVHVSTIGAIFPPSGERMSSDDPVQKGGPAYNASKAEAELHARQLQADGQPVVIVYPGGVIGPKNVGVNAGLAFLAGMLQAPIRPHTGGMLCVDVRDLATALARLLLRRGPRRYIAGGNFVTWEQLVGELQTATGVTRPVRDLTEQDMVAMFGRAGARYFLGMKPVDDAPLQHDTDVTWRPFTETLADFVEWMNSRDVARPAGS
jgi:nucleoside-diphosphate-sugar epimerase